MDPELDYELIWVWRENKAKLKVRKRRMVSSGAVGVGVPHVSVLETWILGGVLQGSFSVTSLQTLALVLR